MAFFHMHLCRLQLIESEINVHINSHIQRGGTIKIYTLGLFGLAKTIWDSLLLLNELAWPFTESSIPHVYCIIIIKIIIRPGLSVSFQLQWIITQNFRKKNQKQYTITYLSYLWAFVGPNNNFLWVLGWAFGIMIEGPRNKTQKSKPELAVIS